MSLPVNERWWTAAAGYKHVTIMFHKLVYKFWTKHFYCTLKMTKRTDHATVLRYVSKYLATGFHRNEYCRNNDKCNIFPSYALPYPNKTNVTLHLNANHFSLRAVIAQSVWRWATGWMIGFLGFDSRWGLGIFLFTTASRTALRPT
jgi:hypothetical protein